MATLVPFSASIDITAANFPSLVHSFRYANFAFNGGLNSTLTCDISGTVLTAASAPTDNGSSWTGGGEWTGTLTACGTTDILLVLTFLQLGTASAQTNYGGTGGGGADSVMMDDAGYYVYANGGTEYASLGNVTPTASYAIDNCVLALACDWNNGTSTQRAVKYFADADEVLTANNSVPTGDLAEGMTSVANIAMSAVANTKYTGIYAFHITSGLWDAQIIKEGCAWMAANHGSIYPGWRYL